MKRSLLIYIFCFIVVLTVSIGVCIQDKITKNYWENLTKACEYETINIFIQEAHSTITDEHGNTYYILNKMPHLTDYGILKIKNKDAFIYIKDFSKLDRFQPYTDLYIYHLLGDFYLFSVNVPFEEEKISLAFHEKILLIPHPDSK